MNRNGDEGEDCFGDIQSQADPIGAIERSDRQDKRFRVRSIELPKSSSDPDARFRADRAGMVNLSKITQQQSSEVVSSPLLVPKRDGFVNSRCLDGVGGFLLSMLIRQSPVVKQFAQVAV